MPEIQLPEWILFDLDNTLLDFNASSKKAFMSLIQSLETNADPDCLFSRYKVLNASVWAERESGRISHERLKVKRWELFFEDQDLKADAISANEHYFDIIRTSVDFVQGTQTLLKRLSGQCRMAIVTNGLSEVQWPRIRRSGIEDFFEHIVISDEIGSAKPQHEFFEHCSQLIGHPDPHSVLVVGDTLESDILGANGYGYRSCWFNHDYLENDTNIKADFELNKLEELVPLLGL